MLYMCRPKRDRILAGKSILLGRIWVWCLSRLRPNIWNTIETEPQGKGTSISASFFALEMKKQIMCKLWLKKLWFLLSQHGIAHVSVPWRVNVADASERYVWLKCNHNHSALLSACCKMLCSNHTNRPAQDPLQTASNLRTRMAKPFQRTALKTSLTVSAIQQHTLVGFSVGSTASNSQSREKCMTCLMLNANM